MSSGQLAGFKTVAHKVGQSEIVRKQVIAYGAGEMDYAVHPYCLRMREGAEQPVVVLPVAVQSSVACEADFSG